MARTPKNGKSGETEVTATTLLLPTESTIQELNKGKRSARKNVREINDAFSKKFSAAVEKKHVDRRAANICFNLDSLSDEQLNVTWFHIHHYAKALGIIERAESQGEMFDQAGDNDKAGDQGDDNKVTRIGTAARKVVEQAGAG